MIPNMLARLITITSLIAITFCPLGAEDRTGYDLFTFDRSSWGARERTEGDPISLKDIPGDLGHNLRGLFTNNNLMPIMIGSGLTGLAVLIDENEFDEEDDFTGLAHELGEESSLGRLGEKMGNHVLLPSVIAGLAVSGQIAGNKRFESFSYSLAQGYIVNNLLTTGLKAASGRTRPNQRNTRSFPSGHTSNAFTWATIINHYYGKRAAIPAYGIASFIAWSRLNMDAHYLSDVTFGAVLGYVVGRTVVNRTDGRVAENRFQFYPTAGLENSSIEAFYEW
jgi:hypothetical protein